MDRLRSRFGILKKCPRYKSGPYLTQSVVVVSVPHCDLLSGFKKSNSKMSLNATRCQDLVTTKASSLQDVAITLGPRTLSPKR